MNRRLFLKNSALATGAFYIGTSRAYAANEDIRVAVIGLNGKGKSAISEVMRTQGAQLVALCDADSAVLERTVANVEKEYAVKVPHSYQDYRKVLDNKAIDAVVIVTPNHWHALMAIQACQAGKDVYCEKPVCHNIWEGRRIIEAAEKYGKIVQSGFQNRSDDGLVEAFPYLMEGNVGKIEMIRGLCYKARSSIGKNSTPLVPPSSVDYNLWLGPAQDEPIYRDKFHYDWHWSWNTGNGDIGNQGPHEIDLIRWLLGDPDHPKKVMSFGGRFGWNDAGETPNMHIASITWGEIPVFFEVRDMYIRPDTPAASSFKGRRIGVVVTCEGGEFIGGRGGGILRDKEGKKIMDWKGDAGFDHFPNFIRAVKSRNATSLRSPIESGFKSSAVAHLCNISYRMGKESSPAAMDNFVSNNEALKEAYERFNKHLGDWEIDLNSEKWTRGHELQFDAKTERFTGGDCADEANKFIKDEYRRDFAVPEIV